MATERQQAPREDTRVPPQPPKQRARVSSSTLLGEMRELIIEHNGREYRLRVTSHGNLILTA
jgi:hemin uptake protein HemP